MPKSTVYLPILAKPVAKTLTNCFIKLNADSATVLNNVSTALVFFVTTPLNSVVESLNCANTYTALPISTANCPNAVRIPPIVFATIFNTLPT